MRSILTPLTLALAAGLVAWLYPRFLSVDADAPKEMQIRRRELLGDLYEVKQSDLLSLQTSGIEWSEATRD